MRSVPTLLLPRTFLPQRQTHHTCLAERIISSHQTMNRSPADNNGARRRSSSSSTASSDFEFATQDGPSSGAAAAALRPAEDLFYKGKILPLHLSPRFSMVRSLLLGNSPSSSASASSNSSASRDSSASSSSTDLPLFKENNQSPRRSSVADLEDVDEYFISISQPPMSIVTTTADQIPSQNQVKGGQRSAKKSKSFSLGKLSSVFKKAEPVVSGAADGSPVKRTSGSSTGDVLRKYMRKVKPLSKTTSFHRDKKTEEPSVTVKASSAELRQPGNVGMFLNSYSGNSTRERRGVVTTSCPTSSRSSPCHSGVLSGPMASSNSSPSHSGVLSGQVARRDWSTEELQSAIQGAIAHCKNSIKQNKAQE